ncbi:uncharacterized protein LOC144579698 [Callithrix jacchus]
MTRHHRHQANVGSPKDFYRGIHRGVAMDVPAGADPAELRSRSRPALHLRVTGRIRLAPVPPAALAPEVSEPWVQLSRGPCSSPVPNARALDLNATCSPGSQQTCNFGAHP